MPRHPHYIPLFNAVRTLRPWAILEIGVYNGQHAEEMIRLAQQLSPGRDIVYYGFDLFTKAPPNELAHEDWYGIDEIRTRLLATGATIHLVAGDTRETLPAFVADLTASLGGRPPLGPFDLVFVDGGHSLETIASDVTHALQLVKPGGQMVLDDYYPGRRDCGALTMVEFMQTTLPGWAIYVHPPTTFANPSGDWVVSMVTATRQWEPSSEPWLTPTHRIEASGQVTMSSRLDTTIIRRQPEKPA